MVIALIVFSLITINTAIRHSADAPIATTDTIDIPAPTEPVGTEGISPSKAESEDGTQTNLATDSDRGMVRANAEPQDGMNEGIEVHGRWTIEVSEPDGKLVSRTEFDNALTTSGAASLAQILSREFTVATWSVVILGTNNANGPCTNNFGDGVGCSISEYPATHATIASSATKFGGLAADSPATGPNAGSLVLTGTATVTNDTDIGRVFTVLSGCSSTSAPSDYLTCLTPNQFANTMTEKTLDTPVPVLTGQVVNVTVVISFS